MSPDIHGAEQALRKIDYLKQEPERPFGPTLKPETAIPCASDAADNEGLKLLLKGVNSLVEGLPALARALDAIAKIHPVVEVAVGAFKVVIELEVRRRDNDNKVKLLFLEMKNMMSTLLQLRDVGAAHTAGDGITIAMRLEELIKGIADDIKACANVCDAYSKKRYLLRVVQGYAWDENLQVYIKLFSDRKSELHLAISLHTGIAVDSAVDKLSKLMQRMDIVLAAFKKAVPHEQRTLADALDRNGGVHNIVHNHHAIQEVLAVEQTMLMSPRSFVQSPSTHAGRRLMDYNRLTHSADIRNTTTRLQVMALSSPGMGQPLTTAPPLRVSPALVSEMQLLREELRDSAASAIQRNLQTFDRKFKIVQEEMLEEMRKDGDRKLQAVQEEMLEEVRKGGERIIDSVLEGPHARVLDRELSAIWREMQWRTIVEARLLVLAVHEHFLHRHRQQRQGVGAEERWEIQSDPDTDESWTLEYISMKRLQPIIEAFDDDASGFVSITEANEMTTSRPNGWSLLRWIAFWAIGWQVACTVYIQRIYALLDRVEKMQKTVRFVNQHLVQIYLDQVRSLIDQMTSGFQRIPEHSHLLSHFRLYVDQEEQRLRNALDIVNYDLDALDTLALVNGRRGIERNLFQFLYLLLSRHVRKVRVAQTKLLHPDELAEAAATVHLVYDAFYMRFQELSELFVARKSNPVPEFRMFACGMFAILSANQAYSFGDHQSLFAGGLFSTAYPIPQLLDEDWVDEAIVDQENTSPRPAHHDNPQEGRPDDATVVLKYAPHCEQFFADDAFAPCDVVKKDDGVTVDIDTRLVPLLGRWTGVSTHDTRIGGRLVPTRFIFIVEFYVSPTDKTSLEGVPSFHAFWPSTTARYTARYDSSQAGYLITKTYDTPSVQEEQFGLFLEDDNLTLVGGCLNTTQSVIMRRGISPEIMVYYPPLDVFKDCAQAVAAARWRFALSAVLHVARQRLCSWSLIRERRYRRKRFFYLVRRSFLSPLPEKMEIEKMSIANTLVPADYHFFAYHSLEPRPPEFFDYPLPRLNQPSTTQPQVLDAPGTPGKPDQVFPLFAAHATSHRHIRQRLVRPYGEANDTTHSTVVSDMHLNDMIREPEGRFIPFALPPNHRIPPSTSSESFSGEPTFEVFIPPPPTPPPLNPIESPICEPLGFPSSCREWQRPPSPPEFPLPESPGLNPSESPESLLIAAPASISDDLSLKSPPPLKLPPSSELPPVALHLSHSSIAYSDVAFFWSPPEQASCVTPSARRPVGPGLQEATGNTDRGIRADILGLEEELSAVKEPPPNLGRIVARHHYSRECPFGLSLMSRVLEFSDGDNDYHTTDDAGR